MGAKKKSKGDTDDLARVAEALEEAADAMREDDTDPPATGEQPAEALGDVSRALYNTCYYLSYGVVFASVYVGRMLPSDNTMGRGLKDGALAAYAAVLSREQEQAEAAADWDFAMADDQAADDPTDGEPALETR